MLAFVESDSDSVSLTVRILTTVLPILAVVLAGVFAFWKQHVSMKAARRDRLRIAYSVWLNALDSHQRALPAVIFATPQEAASDEDQQALDVAHRNEAAAFTYILLLDPDNQRIARAEEIRSQDPHDRDRIRGAKGRNLHERIWSIQMDDERALHAYARQICNELKETV